MTGPDYDPAMRAVWISLGAVAGANARYWLGLALTRVAGSALPWGTLVINVSGSLVLGGLLGVIARRPSVNEVWVLLVGVGFCGAYTTFSTFAAELFGQAQTRSGASMALYIALSVGLALGAAAAGYGAMSAALAD